MAVVAKGLTVTIPASVLLNQHLAGEDVDTSASVKSIDPILVREKRSSVRPSIMIAAPACTLTTP